MNHISLLGNVAFYINIKNMILYYYRGCDNKMIKEAYLVRHSKTLKVNNARNVEDLQI